MITVLGHLALAIGATLASCSRFGMPPAWAQTQGQASQSERGGRDPIPEQPAPAGRSEADVPAALLEAGPSAPPHATSTPDSYRMGPQDKVRIKVYSWRASQDQIFEWTAINLSEDYTVGAAGAISVPLIGELQAAGLTTAEFAAAVSRALKERIGMMENPDASVEIVQFRPFYVVGDVEKAGDFPYRPGLTVMQATAIAGGPFRTRRSDSRLDREIIASEGELELYVAERTSLLIRKARLQAELSGATHLVIPDGLKQRQGDSDISSLALQEELIFKARMDGFSAQMAALEQLKIFLDKEIESLTAQVAAHESEVKTVDTELANIRALAERRLTTDSRRLGLERNRAQVEGERLRLQSNLMRVRQDISKTDLSIVELRNKRATELAADIAEADAKIELLNGKITTTKKLLEESELVGAPPLYGMSKQRLEISYKIIRMTPDRGQIELAATEGSPVEPGDTVKVEMVRASSTVSVGPVTVPLLAQ